MKNRVKGTIMAALVVGMTVSGAAGVYAGANLQKISAYLNHNISFKIDGKTFVPTDGKGNKLAPIVYNDSTYLPVRALSEALKASVDYNSRTGVITIGTPSAPNDGNTGNQTGADLVAVTYSTSQIQAMKKEFAKFDGFTTAYAPMQAVKNDSFQKVAAGGDSVKFTFNHMNVEVSPRDYAFEYDGKNVTLSNGVQAKWYTPSDTAMLTFKLDDRFVTLYSQDHSLSKAQLEKVAVSVAKLK
ncbi:stalk domain-containing protein [Paenibacillus cellulositrophicus]|uniref:stalk domain-containing protein n=1 Tax=Paenibacillus cellulositrophicus TaxID=562959 RepID=UPI0012674765|nr:stalk domain-containing protein [Paenibacillus cellulositrophicus]